MTTIIIIILTRHLKQSKWNVPSSARTNCPVNDSPHFLHTRTWPLAVLDPLALDLFRSPLLLDSLSVLSALKAGEAGGLASWPYPPPPFCRVDVGVMLGISGSLE